jgi:hypothetical protein
MVQTPLPSGSFLESISSSHNRWLYPVRIVLTAKLVFTDGQTAIAADINPRLEPKNQTSKRVWTNDDFPSASPTPAPEETKAKAAPTPKSVVEVAAAQVNVEVENPELAKAKKEVVGE